MSDVLSNEEKYRRILANHLPSQAVDWVYAYLERHRVHFHITRERLSKLGDYRWPQGPRHPMHEISVNGDLNPYLFLWVFLHEAAHLETHLKYTAVQPHGHEWQEEYRCLLAEHASWFPAEVQSLLAVLVRRIPLNRASMRAVEQQLHCYDPAHDGDAPRIVLDQLQPGAQFFLKKRDDMRFVALERRRTRWLCREQGSGRQYLVSGTAEVVPVPQG